MLDALQHAGQVVVGHQLFPFFLTLAAYAVASWLHRQAGQSPFMHPLVLSVAIALPAAAAETDESRFPARPIRRSARSSITANINMKLRKSEMRRKRNRKWWKSKKLKSAPISTKMTIR